MQFKRRKHQFWFRWSLLRQERLDGWGRGTEMMQKRGPPHNQPPAQPQAGLLPAKAQLNQDKREKAEETNDGWRPL